jgi:hypothetical protein
MLDRSKGKPDDLLMMKKTWPLLLALSLCGCAHQYVMKLTNGTEITAAGKPKLKGAVYYYNGPHGETQAVQQSRVLEIEPESMAQEEKKKFKVSEPYKKHWYWPF